MLGQAIMNITESDFVEYIGQVQFLFTLCSSHSARKRIRHVGLPYLIELRQNVYSKQTPCCFMGFGLCRKCIVVE